MSTISSAPELEIVVSGRRQAEPESATVRRGGRLRWRNDSELPIKIRFKEKGCPIKHEHGPRGCEFEIPPRKHGDFCIVQDERGQFSYQITITEYDDTAGTPRIIIQ